MKKGDAFICLSTQKFAPFSIFCNVTWHQRLWFLHNFVFFGKKNVNLKLFLFLFCQLWNTKYNLRGKVFGNYCSFRSSLRLQESLVKCVWQKGETNFKLKLASGQTAFLKWIGIIEFSHINLIWSCYFEWKNNIFRFPISSIGG